MNIIVTIQIIMVKTLIVYTIMLLTIGIIIVERVKSLNFDVVLEECPFVYLILGYVMDE